MGLNKTKYFAIILGIAIAAVAIFLISVIALVIKKIKDKREALLRKRLSTDDYFSYNPNSLINAESKQGNYAKVAANENPFAEDYSEAVLARPAPVQYENNGTDYYRQ